MTIFVDVLVKLIREHLSHISSNLTTQSKGVGYNHKLSLDQKDIISTLEAAMVLFKSTHDDKADSEAIAKLLTASRIKIQEIREKHGEPREEGKTRACLVNLILHTTGFYTKLAEFPFNLLNKEHTSTPENIVYYHACYYFGEEIFDPKAHSDVGIRAKKEGALEKRLQSLSELIKPTYTLQEQRIRTLQVLEDLAADNKIVISGGSTSGMVLPSVTLFGLFQLKSPNEWFASPGRLNEQLKSAWRKIEEMTEEQFDAPQVLDGAQFLAQTKKEDEAAVLAAVKAMEETKALAAAKALEDAKVQAAAKAEEEAKVVAQASEVAKLQGATKSEEEANALAAAKAAGDAKGPGAGKSAKKTAKAKSQLISHAEEVDEQSSEHDFAASPGM